jgi:hypothetical protein
MAVPTIPEIGDQEIRRQKTEDRRQKTEENKIPPELLTS